MKPSTISGIGVGVFILHDVSAGTPMMLFLDSFEEEVREEKDVPPELRIYCLYQGEGKILCPKYFNRLDIGNYLNHSNEPNLTYEKGKGYSAARDIKAGEELFADYRELDEPVDQREEYYK